MNWFKSVGILFLLLLTFGCNDRLSIEGGPANDITGFFLLNEGNMSYGRSTLDYYDYASGIYTKRIYQERNPDEEWGLGSVGNDMAIYGSKLYVVVNCSNMVKVMDVRTLKQIEAIYVQNCRSITFKDQYAYVSSYDCLAELNPEAGPGCVVKIDTTSLTPEDACPVGYQPEEMAIVGDYLYVANSGGYRVPDYDNTVSVIDLNTFREIKKIDVAPNLHRMEADAYGNIWVSSRGDYYDIPSMTFVISTENQTVVEQLDQLPCTDMTLCGDSLYVFSNTWNDFTQSRDISYAIVDVKTHEVLTRSFITDSTETLITNPYGIAVNPITREILITDARDYITHGELYCFSPAGQMKWSVSTGDIPSRIVFTRTPLQ